MKSLWIDAHAKTIANRHCARVSSNQTQRIKIYERGEYHVDSNVSRIRPFQRIKFRRKIYDRTAEDATFHALDGYYVSSKTMNETENVFLINTSLVCRDLFCYKMEYLYAGETGRNLKVPPDILVTLWNSLVGPSSGTPPILNVHFSGSNFEGLDVPPTIKEVRLQDNGNTVTLIEQCDVDAMVVVSGISLSTSEVTETLADGTAEVDSTRHGYLRIRLSERFLKQNSDKLAHCIKDAYLRNNYFEMFYSELQALFEKATACQEKTTPTPIIKVGAKGPALNICFEALSSIPTGKHSRYLLNDFDIVFALKYPTWPSVADEWLNRERRYGWPSHDLIEKVKSYGSYVVATSHDLSDIPEIEFRFSFSVAEHLLADELSFEQKQCYVSFKSAVNHVKKELERQIKTETGVKSYHLKNVFFWTCERIPAEEFQSSSGWTKCFFFLIDQLLHCLRQKVLPGYFIKQYNLFDAVPSSVLDCLADKVSALSRDPFSKVTDFLNTLVLYNGLQLKETLHTGAEITDKTWGLELLHNLVIAFDENAKCRFWKKSCALEIFARWCKSHFSSNLTRCLSSKMTLFDIVHLDIVHHFDLSVSISLLKEFSDRETSADVVNKLALCYVEAGNDKLTAYGHSNFEKAMILFRLSSEKHPSLVNVIEFASFLHDSEKDGEALIVLESTNQQVAESQFENIFDQAQTMTSLMKDIDEEMEELVKFGAKYLPAAIPIYHLLLKCYRKLDMQDAEDSQLNEFEFFCNQLETSRSHLSWYMLGMSLKRIGRMSHADECLRKAARAKLPRGIITPVRALVDYSTRCPHAMISLQYMFFMLSILMPEMGTPAQFKKLIEEQQMLVHNMPFVGSNLSKIAFLLLNNRWTPGENEIDRLGLNFICTCIVKWSAMSNTPTLSNRLYYSQVLMNCTTGRPALPILLEIVQTARKNFMSVIVWPKYLKSSVDDHIRRELDSISEDGFIIVPTIVYAYYLLATLYLRLVQMHEYFQIMFEFQSLCQDLESVYPLSYSLLGYAYEQSGRYAQAVSSHGRARELLPNNELIRRNLSNANLLEQTNPPIRRSTLNDRSKLNQEKGSEIMWQMYTELPSTVPDKAFLDTPEELMKTFETGRTVDECYGCRFAEFS